MSLTQQGEPRLAIARLEEGLVEIWNLAANEKVITLQVAEAGQLGGLVLFPLVISADGEQLAVLKDPYTIETWDVATGQRLLTLPERSIVAGRLWFSPDARWLAVGDCTGTVEVWDTASGEHKLTLPGHTACITGIAFSPDGKLLAVSTVRGALKIWDFETGQELGTLPVSGFSPQFTPDGTGLIMVALGERDFVDTTVRMYLVRLEDLVALAKTRITRTLTTDECQTYLRVEQCH
jgi:WD40 repeat protein